VKHDHCDDDHGHDDRDYDHGHDDHDEYVGHDYDRDVHEYVNVYDVNDDDFLVFYLQHLLH